MIKGNLLLLWQQPRPLKQEKRVSFRSFLMLRIHVRVMISLRNSTVFPIIAHQQMKFLLENSNENCYSFAISISCRTENHRVFRDFNQICNCIKFLSALLNKKEWRQKAPHRISQNKKKETCNSFFARFSIKIFFDMVKLTQR